MIVKVSRGKRLSKIEELKKQGRAGANSRSSENISDNKI